MTGDKNQPDRDRQQPTASSIDVSSPAENPQETASQDLDSLRSEVHEANERALRSHAELENFRKRARREMEEERRYASLPLVRDLLQVLDNLERAIEAAGKSDTATGLLDGVRMVSQQMTATLTQHHCTRIDAIGAPFDPHLHEAAGQEPTDQFEPGCVSREIRSGYLLHDRVVRPAQVLIAAPPLASEPTAGE
ncbi:MAG: nucleotide exchange factor GrpE [Pirellulaceae bacterium]